MGEPARVDRRVPLIVGLIGAVASVVAAKGYHPGIGNDATSYIAIADHLAAGKGLGYFLEPTLGLWPPGFPVLLAIPKWLFDVNPQFTALVVNALSPFAIALLSHALLRMLCRDQRVINVGVVVATLGPATLSQTYMVQTEPTFIVLVLLTIWALFRFAATHRWAFMALAVGAQWLAYMDRYVGLVMIGSGALWLVFDHSFDRWGERIRNAAVFFVGACLVPGAWILRNWIVVGEPFGIRDTPTATVRSNLVDAITSISQYLHGWAEYEPFTGLRRLISLALLAVVGVLTLWLARRAIPRGTSVVRLLGHPVGLLTIFATAHAAYMVYSASTIAFDPVNTRYLVPMFIPALIAGLTLVDRNVAPRQGTAAADGTVAGSPASWLVGGLAVLAVVQLGVAAVRVSASYWDDRAQRYNSDTAVRIQESPVFDRMPDDCRLLSNFPEFTYLAGVEAQRSPRITKFASSDRQTDLEDLRREVADGGDVCLIWIDDDASEIFYHPSYQHPLDRLDEEFDLQRIDGDEDVDVFRVLPA